MCCVILEMADFRRPKLTNDEDELLQMQQDFLAGKIQKSNIEVLKVSRPAAANQSTTDEPKKSSFFSRKRENLVKEKERAVTVEFTDDVKVLRDVVEKIHFPAMVSRGSGSKAQQPSGKKSIFAQQMHKKVKMEEEVVTNHQKPLTNLPFAENKNLSLCNPIASAVLGETEAMKIHQENLQKLDSYSEEELLQEQQKLLNSMDPKLLAFLKNKKPAPVSNKMDCEEGTNVAERVTRQVPVIPEELKNPNWLNMDVVEEDKISWMNPSMPAFKELAGQVYEARFDFDGK